MNYYNRLSNTELEALEKDFINFLVLNGIIGEDWSKMKKDSPEKAEAIVDQFSEVVFETSLRKAKFLLMVDAKTVMSFQCQSEKIVMMSIKYTGESEFDFHEIDDLQTFISKQQDNLEIQNAEKAYKKKREYEMYDMIKSGCKVSEGKVFKLLALYWAEMKASKN